MQDHEKNWTQGWTLQKIAAMNTNTLLGQTMVFRGTLTRFLQGIDAEQAEVMPPTWKNNARWHAGHLIVTPRLVTYGVMGKPLGVPEEYRKWFAKGTSPADWGSDDVPTYADLVADVLPSVERLFAELAESVDTPFEKAYTTSVGVVLATPAESLNFSLVHDGMHLGMLLALKRALNS